MQLDATIRNAGGELERRSDPIDRNSYGFLFRDLRSDPWQPDRGDPEEIFTLSQTLYGKSEDNKEIPAGYAFFGQFITHDLTFAVPPFGHPDKRINQRTPRFDLDSVYAGGPDVHPHLYQLADPRLFVIGRNPAGEFDLPRNGDTSLDLGGTGDFDRRRRALIGDPRNDENTIISQLHLAFLRLHNRLAQNRTFEEARRITQWTYQHAMLDFLRRVCGRELVDSLLSGRVQRKLFNVGPDRVFLPVEFSFAAFRMGHSMLSATYHLNDALEKERGMLGAFGLFADAMSWSERNAYAENTLEGERALPTRWTVQWDRFVGPKESAKTQWSKKIDTDLAEPLRTLPLLGAIDRDRSLSYRTLVAGTRQSLPSGQKVAERVLDKGEKPLLGNDPLWVYVLREAEASGGTHLGTVGARIVAEVCIGLLAVDPDSFYRKDQDWTPWREAEFDELTKQEDFRERFKGRTSTEFSFEDLLWASGAPITSEHWKAQVPSATSR